jgi:hypothetical protein
MTLLLDAYQCGIDMPEFEALLLCFRRETPHSPLLGTSAIHLLRVRRPKDRVIGASVSTEPAL